MSEEKNTVEKHPHGNQNKIIAFYTKNTRAVQIGAGVLVAAVAAVIYLNISGTKKEEEANTLLFKIENAFALDSFDLVLKGDAKDPESKGAIDFVEEYGNTPAAQKAALMAGRAYMAKGDFNSAIEYLKKFKLKDQLLRPKAMGLLGDCYSDLGDYENAESNYKDAINYTNNLLTTPMFLKKLGLVQEKLGKYDAAAKTFSRIKKEYSESEQANEIDKYIGRAKAKAGINSFDNN